MPLLSSAQLMQVRRAVIAIIRCCPENSRLYRWLFCRYHTLFFLYRHHRYPVPGLARFNDFQFGRKISGCLRDSLKRRVTDKALGKHFIAEHLGPDRTIATLAVLPDAQSVVRHIPAQFPIVIKPTHSSNRMRVISSQADYEQAIPLMLKWLQHDFFLQELEENYQQLSRKIIVEPFLDPAYFLEGSIHCREGRAKIVSVIDRFDPQKRRESFNRNWHPLCVALGQPYKALALSRPAFLENLLRDAETLAQDFDFIRIDFYASQQGYLFGELTNLPGGALACFSSLEGEQRFNQAFFG